MNTPETDEMINSAFGENGNGEDYAAYVAAMTLCKKLETERNEARKQRDEYMEGWQLECEFRDMYRKQRDEAISDLKHARQQRDAFQSEMIENAKQRDELIEILHGIAVHEECRNRGHAAVATIAKEAIANVKGEME